MDNWFSIEVERQFSVERIVFLINGTSTFYIHKQNMKSYWYLTLYKKLTQDVS